MKCEKSDDMADYMKNVFIHYVFNPINDFQVYLPFL